MRRRPDPAAAPSARAVAARARRVTRAEEGWRAAAEVIGPLQPDTSLCVLTRGQISMIDAMRVPDQECVCLQCEVERLKVENERLRVGMSHCLLGETGGDCYAAECVDLRAEVERLRANAKRYEWLRDNSYLWGSKPRSFDAQGEPVAMWVTGNVELSSAGIDCAIDAAMKTVSAGARPGARAAGEAAAGAVDGAVVTGTGAHAARR